MFNLLPGIHPLAYGLGHMRATDVDVPADVDFPGGGSKITKYDNPYIISDDNEVIDILTILFGVLKDE